MGQDGRGVEGREGGTCAPRLVGARFMKLVGIEVARGADRSGDRVREGTGAGTCGKEVSVPRVSEVVDGRV